jgi:hypothetical protein
LLARGATLICWRAKREAAGARGTASVLELLKKDNKGVLFGCEKIQPDRTAILRTSMGNKGQHTQESKVENEFVAQYVLKKGERISAALTMLGRLIGQYDLYGSAFVKMSHNVLNGCVLFSSALTSGEGLAAARNSAAQALQQTRSILSSAVYAGIINEHNFLSLSKEVSALNVRINNIT